MKKRRGLLYILIFLTVAVLVLLVFFLSPSASVDTPAIVLPDTSVNPVSETDSVPENEGRVIAVTPGTVQAAISTLSRAGSYSRTITVESFWSGGSSSRTIGVWVNGSDAKFLISNGHTVKNVLISGDELWIWYSDSPDVYIGPASDSAADEYQGLLTYEDILNLDPASITDAGYTEYSGERCIYVEYSDGVLGYVSHIWVSVDTGLLMGSQTMDGDTLIYRMSSSTPDISTPDESVFQRPDVTSGTSRP